MDTNVFKRAYARFRRALTEATYLYNQRSEHETKQLKDIQGDYKRQAVSLGEAFGSTGELTCATCGRCCSKAAMDSGYFSHEERQLRLSDGVNLEDYIVSSWEDQEQEPPERCLFLSSGGCNIPTEHRSANCLTYVCHDRLGPELVRQGLAESVAARKQELLTTRARVYHLPVVPFSNETRNFGEG